MPDPQYSREACKPHPQRLLGLQAIRQTQHRTQGARHTKRGRRRTPQAEHRRAKEFPTRSQNSKLTSRGKRKNRVAPIETRAIRPVLEESRHWLLQPITFDHQDYSRSIRNAGWTALVLDLIIDGLHFTQVLMDGGSGLNLLYQDTIRKMGINQTKNRHGNTSFQGVTPGPDTHCTGFSPVRSYVRPPRQLPT